MSDLPQHPLIDAVKPVLDMLGAQIIPVEDALISDRALEWEGTIIAAVRLPRLQRVCTRWTPAGCATSPPLRAWNSNSTETSDATR